MSSDGTSPSPRLLEWWLLFLAVVASVTAFLIASHAWRTIEDHALKSLGPTGDEGPIGALGPRGERGIPGPRGPRGGTGVRGGRGPTGPLGMTGETGAMGQQGAVGLPGPFGPAVHTGPTGPAGFRGFASATGNTGPNSTSANTGPTGVVGATGSAFMGYLSAVYSVAIAALPDRDSVFSSPLTTAAKMNLVQLIDRSQGAFTFNDGIIGFPPSTTSAFNVRVSIAGFISGDMAAGGVPGFASVSFAALPITARPWVIGASYAAGSSQHIFSSTVSDTIHPSAASNPADMTFHVKITQFWQNPELTVSSLAIEISQLSS